MKKVILLGMIFLLSACQMTSKTEQDEYVYQEIIIKNIIVKNKTIRKINKVKITIPETDKFIAVEFIASGYKAVLPFNNKYETGKYLKIKYGSSSNEKYHKIRIPEVSKINHKGYDLKIELLKFGLSIKLEEK
jgi:hypothetical protein